MCALSKKGVPLFLSIPYVFQLIILGPLENDFFEIGNNRLVFDDAHCVVVVAVDVVVALLLLLVLVLYIGNVLRLEI